MTTTARRQRQQVHVTPRTLADQLALNPALRATLWRCFDLALFLQAQGVPLKRAASSDDFSQQFLAELQRRNRQLQQRPMHTWDQGEMGLHVMVSKLLPPGR